MSQKYFGKGISVGSGFDLGANLPLDNRTVAATIAERDTIPTIQLYKGLQVFVEADATIYVLIDFNADGTNRVWNKLASATASGNVIDIIDNLESDLTNAALSAKQGKVLKTEIDTVKSSLSSVYNYKGSVDNYAALEAIENPVKGDVYNVVAANGNIPAGTNYAYNGTEWDALGGSVDLSGYYNKDEVDQAIEDAVDAAVEPLQTSITTVSNQINSKVDKVENAGLISDTDLNKFRGYESTIADLTASTSDLSDSIQDLADNLKIKEVSTVASNGIKLQLSEDSELSIDVNVDTLAGKIDEKIAHLTINAGNGINVTGEGKEKTISLKLASNSALALDDNNALTLVWEDID